MGIVAKRLRNGLLLGVLLAGMLGAVPVATALEIGELAPDFMLLSTTGEKISLSQFRGKTAVLIEFYGADFSPTCVKNLVARKADYSKFQGLNVQVLGISDGNPFSQKALSDSLKLPYPLLSDFPDLQVLRRYGVLEQSQVSGSRRAFFLVDQQGIVRGQWWGESFDVFSSENILQAAQAMLQKP